MILVKYKYHSKSITLVWLTLNELNLDAQFSTVH